MTIKPNFEESHGPNSRKAFVASASPLSQSSPSVRRMRYLENAVVDAIRTWAAQTPQDAHVSLGDISYTLMDNHLVLKNVRMTYVTLAKQTVAATVETLDIRNPGPPCFR